MDAHGVVILLLFVVWVLIAVIGGLFEVIDALHARRSGDLGR
jgi:hypothetical protein